MPALKQGLKTGGGPAFINQTRHPEYFFHQPRFFYEKVACELHRSPDLAIPTSLAEVGFS